MAWGGPPGSAVFAVQVLNLMGPGAVSGQSGIKPVSDHFSVALYGNSITPDRTVATLALTQWTNSGGTGQWSAATGGEVTGTGYTAGGASVTPVAITQASNVVTFTSSGTPTWTTASFTAYGGLVYDTNQSYTTPNTGFCFNYFGGAQTVTAGTFTLTWNSSGIATFST